MTPHNSTKLRFFVLALLLAAMPFCAPPSASADSSSVMTETKRVAAAGASFDVSLVRIDLLDPTLSVEPVAASGGIGHDEDFASLVSRSHAVAAVNGTFFNAYEKDDTIRYPNGLLAAEGSLLHSGENQSLIVNKEKTASIRQIRAGVSVKVHSGSRTYPISPWGVNKYYGEDATDQVVLYTRAFGPQAGFPNGMNIVIENGRVTSITEQPAAIPEEGYVIFVGMSENNRRYLLPSVHIGDVVDVVPTASDMGGGGQGLDPHEWLAAIGAGPKLVTAGAVDVDFARDGFADPKITEQANRRSFVGIDASGRLVMGTVGSATVPQLAEAARALGLVEAMNLDGGSSSALYASGTTLTKPGRRLSNILAVRKLDEPAVQIVVNGAYRSDYRGFIRSGLTMVPFRPLLESMKASFRWDDATRTLTVGSGLSALRMQPDQADVTVGGGATRTLEAAPVIVDGHLYVPLRFVVETYGGRVSWDPKLYRVDVTLP